MHLDELGQFMQYSQLSLNSGGFSDVDETIYECPGLESQVEPSIPASSGSANSNAEPHVDFWGLDYTISMAGAPPSFGSFFELPKPDTYPQPPAPTISLPKECGTIAERSQSTNERRSLSPPRQHGLARKRRFPCPHRPCPKNFTSRNDLDRHLTTRKHRKDGQRSELGSQYKCKISWCKRSQDGFSRKDHFLRHMEKMHPGLENDGIEERA